MTFLASTSPLTTWDAVDVPAALAFAYGVIRLFMSDDRRERETRKEEAKAQQEVARAMDEQARLLESQHRLIERMLDHDSGSGGSA